jgi:hypothetical protein
VRSTPSRQRPIPARQHIQETLPLTEPRFGPHEIEDRLDPYLRPAARRRTCDLMNGAARHDRDARRLGRFERCVEMLWLTDGCGATSSNTGAGGGELVRSRARCHDKSPDQPWDAGDRVELWTVCPPFLPGADSGTVSRFQRPQVWQLCRAVRSTGHRKGRALRGTLGLAIVSSRGAL